MAERIIGILDGRRITYFEFATALAMLWFAERKVDMAILEVGLGGRLDATNVITPLVSVITNVGMDHEQYLGNSLAEIAAEKAGIIKPGIPVVSGATDPEVPKGHFLHRRVPGLPPLSFEPGFLRPENPEQRSWSYQGIPSLPRETAQSMTDLPLAVKGDYQVGNSALALAALEISGQPAGFRSAIRRGLEHVVWPGRLEEFHLNTGRRIHYLLDGAHNPDGARPPCALPLTMISTISG